MLCGINKVDQLGQVLPTQGSVEFTQFLELPCFTSLPRADLIPLEFRLEKSDVAVDFSNIHLELVLKVVKKDGSNITNKDWPAPINQIIYSLFRSIDVYISNQRISLNQSNFPYLAYLQSLLFASKDRKTTLMKDAGWFADDSALFDELPIKTRMADGIDSETNPTFLNDGMKNRYLLIMNSALCVLTAPVLLDTLLIPRVLPTQTEITFVFNRAEHSFCLQAKEDNYKIQIDGAKMFVSRMELSPNALAYQNSLLSAGGIDYPALRYDIRTMGIAKAAQNVDWTIFVGEMPQRIYFFHCLQSAYNGEIAKNAFNFELFDLKALQVLANGRSLPINQPMVKKTDTQRNYLSLYYMSFNGLEAPPSFDGFDFSNGFGVVAIDLSRTLSAGCDYSDAPVSGNLRIISSYKEGMPEPVILFCVGEFRKTLRIDQDRNPTWI